MDLLAEKGFDFSMRISELVRYLRDDSKGFPLSDTLLACGIGAGLACRNLQSGLAKKQRLEKTRQARSLIEEADFIIEMAVKGGYLTELQSVYIRADCKALSEALHKNDIINTKQ